MVYVVLLFRYNTFDWFRFYRKFDSKQIDYEVFKCINLRIGIRAIWNKKSTLPFSELVQIIRREILKQNTEKTVQLAEKHGLSLMTMNEVNEEIKAYRNEKTNS